MTLTNFPDGISSFGLPVIGSGSLPIGNSYRFVSSVRGSDGNDGSFEAPYATIDYAVGTCTASAGDVIVVLPGHAETIASSTALALDVAGITIVGIGDGGMRPTITLSTTNTATIAVSAANITVSNIVVIANFLSIAAAFTLSTAKDFTLKNCAFRDTSGILNFLNIVKSTGAANTVDRLTVTDCVWNGLGTTSVNSFILTANDIDGATVVRNRVKLARTADASILITVTAGVLTNLDCGWNRVYSKQTATTAGSLINVGGTTSTGLVYNNYAQTLTTSGDKLFTTTVGLASFENRVTGAVGATGFVIPAVDS